MGEESIAHARQQIADHRWEAAIATLQPEVEQHADHWDAWYYLGVALHRAGRLDEAEHAHTRAAESPNHRMQAMYNLAATKARQGDADRALESLALACEAGYADLEQIRTDPDFESLQDHPRFLDLVAMMRHEGEVG